MAKERKYSWLDLPVYLVARFVSLVLHCFPIEFNIAVAKMLGSGLYLIDAKHRKRAQWNIRRSFPELPEREIERIAHESAQNLVMLAIEILFTTDLIRLACWRRRVELENFTEVLELLIRQERGVIMLTGHYGNWEVLGYLLATLGFDTTSVARPLDNPYLNEWVLGVRERQGQRIVDKKGATVEVGPVLDEKGAVGFIADQNAGQKGMFVDFFGRKASTYKSIGLLAMQYEVPVVIGYARRVAGAFQFKVGVEDIIHPVDWKDQEDPLRYITQRYTSAIEALVRKDPAQYLWMHRRWKTRPKGEEPERYD
jgi:KDO2-lipid IV(A) lauroyltransferase